MNYKEARTRLGKKDRVKLCNNTYLERISDSKFGVRLHDTFVVTFTPTYVELNDGGWPTMTTWDRMTRFSPVRVGGGSKGARLWLAKDGGYWDWDNEYVYYSGIRVSPNGKRLMKTQPNKPNDFEPTVSRSGWSGMTRGESERWNRERFAGGFETAIRANQAYAQIGPRTDLTLEEKAAANLAVASGPPVTAVGPGFISYSMNQDDIRKCPFSIFSPEHYRSDGSCRCDDAEHRKMMISEWDYSEDDFSDIPLRD